MLFRARVYTFSSSPHPGVKMSSGEFGKIVWAQIGIHKSHFVLQKTELRVGTDLHPFGYFYSLGSINLIIIWLQ